jgi:hypothetical protein
MYSRSIHRLAAIGTAVLTLGGAAAGIAASAPAAHAENAECPYLRADLAWLRSQYNPADNPGYLIVQREIQADLKEMRQLGCASS